MNSASRLAVTLMAAVSLLHVSSSVQAAPTADAPPGVPISWVRKAPDGWVYWVPTKNWTDKHSRCGIDISSPTGTMIVGIGGGPTPIALDTQQAFVAIVEAYEGDEGLADVRVVKKSRIVTAQGEQTQSFLVRGTRTVPGMPPMSVTATISVRVLTFAGSHGLEASVVLAPTKDWKRQAKTLGIIVKNVTMMATDCLVSQG